MKIMLDIGSRNGESLEEFVRWDFDEIHAFEPMPAQFANIIAKFADEPRVIPHHCGVSDTKGVFPVYGADDNGEASLFASKLDLDNRTVTECQFVTANHVFETYVPDDAECYMKLNCEGAEVAILNSLMDSGQLRKVAAFRVELDISRCVGFEHEADLLLARLDAEGYDNYTVGSDARMVNGYLTDRVTQEGTHHDRLWQWLTHAGA